MSIWTASSIRTLTLLGAALLPRSLSAQQVAHHKYLFQAAFTVEGIKKPAKAVGHRFPVWRRKIL